MDINQIARYTGAAAGRTLTMAAYGYYWAAIFIYTVAQTWFATTGLALVMFVRNNYPAWVPAVKGFAQTCFTRMVVAMVTGATEFAIAFSYGLDAIKLALLWFVMQQFGTSECLTGFQAWVRMVYIDTHEAMYV